MSPHKKTRLLDSSSGLDDPTISILELPDEEAFDNWLNSQNKIVEWNLTRLRSDTISDQKLPEGQVKWLPKRDDQEQSNGRKILRAHLEVRPEPARENNPSAQFQSHPEKWGDSVTASATFIFAFCSNWQVEVFLKYNSLVFLDATHNTCISLEDRHRKAFLYTILVKHDIAGCGIPVAFMITNSETQWPLATWLNWLRENYLMPQSPKIMIDCSATEMAAIERSFENPQIRLCHWHMLRALQKQVNSKIKTPLSLEEQPIAQTRRSAIQDFLELMHTDSIEKFGQIWREYHEKYYQHEEWLRYLNENWLKQPEKWWSGNRSGMLEINTNNYVESWHNTLKSGYLGGSRKQRPDILVHLLLREVLPDFRVKVARVTMGLDRRRLSKPEKVQLKKCTEISSEIAATLVRHSVVESGEAMYSEVILVKSFTNNEQDYVVSLNPVSAIICCSCNYMIESKSVCKHMFLAQAVLGYSISYDTRLSKKPDDCGKSMLAANAGSSSTLNDARFESDNFLKASLSEQMGILTPYASSSIPLDDEEREMMRVARDQLARINRYRESKDRSWSKRQRR